MYWADFVRPMLFYTFKMAEDNLRCNIDPKGFSDGKCPNYFQDNLGRTWQYSHSQNGLCCFSLGRMGAVRKKKKKNKPSCVCSASISANPTTVANGGPFTLNYTTSVCATSASISNNTNADIINAPPPGGAILLTSMDVGYPTITQSPQVVRYTITVITDGGSCTSFTDITFVTT